MLLLIDTTQLAVIGLSLILLLLPGLLLVRIALRIRQQARDRSRRAETLNDLPAELRWRVFERDGYICQRCGTQSDLLVDFGQDVPGDRVVPLRQLTTRCVRCSAIERQLDMMNTSTEAGH